MPRRAVLGAASLGISVLLLPSAAHATSEVPPDGDDPPVGLSITSVSGSNEAVTLVWEDGR
jgi:hypothetical protein